VRAVLALADDKRAIGQVFNIGNPEEVSIYDLARMVKATAESSSEIKVISYDEAYQPGFEDMDRRVPSIVKLSKLTGYKPKYGLKEIVSRVIDARRTEIAAVSAVPVTAALQPHSLRAGVAE
jgi:UDP-glucose 4-epimerase